MRRSIRFIHAGLEVLALLATALAILVFGLSARSALWSNFVATENEELERSAYFLENHLNDRLAFFKAYADDVLAGKSVTPPPGFEDLAIIDAATISVSEVLPGVGSSSLFPGYNLGAQASGRFYAGLADQELAHSGVVRTPELDIPSVYYALRHGESIVAGRAGTGSIRQALQRASDVAGGAYLVASADGFILVSSLDQPAPFPGIDTAQSGTRRIGNWYVTVLGAPALGGHLVRLTEPARIDRLMGLMLLALVPAILVMGLFGLLKFLAGYGYIVRPLERLVAALPAWPEHPVDSARSDLMPRELDALFHAFGSAGSRILSTVAALSSARTGLVRANEELETRVRERTAQLALANDQILAQEKMAALGRLAAGVAHELNTPLAAISSALQRADSIIGDELARWFSRVVQLGVDDLDLLGRLLSERGGPILDTGVRFRDRVAGLRSCLQGHGVQKARVCATVLAELGLDADSSLVGELAARASLADIVELADAVSTLSRSVAIAKDGAERSARVVAALRGYTWESTGLKNGVVDVGSQLNAALVLLGDRLKHGITASVSCPEGLLVRGDADRLMQVWLNLLTNAIQAIGVKGVLEVALTGDAETVSIAITDSGPGIPDNIRDKIFRPFFTTKPRGEGTGLGLDICRKILDASGGAIRFESEPGRTVFTVNLPAHPDPVS
ncbi:MAG: sensor histidine kinase [Clostridia bacterium]